MASGFSKPHAFPNLLQPSPKKFVFCYVGDSVPFVAVGAGAAWCGAVAGAGAFVVLCGVVWCCGVQPFHALSQYSCTENNI